VEVGVGQRVVDEERGHEEPAQQQRDVFVLLVVQRVALDGTVLLVGGRVVGAVRGDVDVPAGTHAVRLDHEMRRHGEETEGTLALGHVRVARANHVAVAHGGDASPGLAGGERVGRKEAPVVEHVAGGGVADVVRREREAVDAEQNLPRLQHLVDLDVLEARPREVVPPNPELRSLHACSPALAGIHYASTCARIGAGANAGSA